MHRTLLLTSTALALAALGATAARAETAGYLETHGAFEWGSSTNFNPAPTGTATWSDGQFGGSGRVAGFGSGWSVQVDAWSTAAFDAGFLGADWGTSLHLTGRASDGTVLFGPFGSIGSGGFNSGLFNTLGLEAAFNGDRWRLYAQGGLARGMTGDAATAGERDLYATAAINYFVTPNFFVSANIGADRWSQINGDQSEEISFGGKLEFKPDAAPLSFFLGVQQFRFTSTYGASTDFDVGVDTIVFAGLRFPLGDADTLRDLQRDVGLADLNPLYGDLVNR